MKLLNRIKCFFGLHTTTLAWIEDKFGTHAHCKHCGKMLYGIRLKQTGKVDKMPPLTEPPWLMLVRRFRRILYHADYIISKYDLNGNVLDVGCGRRGWLSLLAKSYFNSFVVTFDVVPEKVRDAKEIAKALGLRSDGYVTATAYSLPFKDGVFDKAIGSAILHHLLEKIDIVAKEIFRVTKDNGAGVFSAEIVASRFWGWLWKKLALEKAPALGGGKEGIATKKDWVKAFENAGFSEVQVLREKLYGYVTKPLKTIIYYRFAKYFPDEFVIKWLVTSATITFNKSTHACMRAHDDEISHIPRMV